MQIMYKPLQALLDSCTAGLCGMQANRLFACASVSIKDELHPVPSHVPGARKKLTQDEIYPEGGKMPGAGMRLYALYRQDRNY
jgi:hypothetical protein